MVKYDDDVDLAAELVDEFLSLIDVKAVNDLHQGFKKISKEISDSIDVEALKEFGEEFANDTKQMIDDNVDMDLIKQEALHTQKCVEKFLSEKMHASGEVMDTTMKAALEAIQSYLQNINLQYEENKEGENDLELRHDTSTDNRSIFSGEEARDGISAEIPLPVIGVVSRSSSRKLEAKTSTHLDKHPSKEEEDVSKEEDPSKEEVDTSKEEVDPSKEEVDPSKVEVDPSKVEVDPSKVEVDPSKEEGKEPTVDEGNSKESVEEQQPSNENDVDYDTNKTELYSLIESQKWDEVMDCLKGNPEEASVFVCRFDAKDSSKLTWRMLPIHAACYPKTTLDSAGKILRVGTRAKICVIEELLRIYPEGARMKDDVDMVPLHLACRNGAATSVITCLLDKAPETAMCKDYKGRTPLELVEHPSSNTLNKQRIIRVLKDHKMNQTNILLRKVNSQLK